MANVLKVKPGIIPEQNAMYFTNKELNRFQRETFLDNYSLYQQNYNVYNWLQINNKHKFIVHTIKGSPLMWQAWKKCDQDETRSMSIGKREAEPERVFLKERLCQDELFDSCYEQMLEYRDSDGQVEYNQEGQEMINQLSMTLMDYATLGIRHTLAVGGYHDIDNVNFDPNADIGIKDAFRKVYNNATGYVTKFRDWAANEGVTNLNLGGALSSNDFNASGEYTGDILDLYDVLKRNAPQDLKSLIISGGSVSTVNGDVFKPLFLLSDQMFAQIDQAYIDQANQVATNRVRIERRDVGENVVYFIDGKVPVVQASEISAYDKFVGGRLHFAGIVASSNISLGSSFGEVGSVDNQDGQSDQVGILMQRNDSLFNGQIGEIMFNSQALLHADLKDPNYASAVQLFVEN